MGIIFENHVFEQISKNNIVIKLYFNSKINILLILR